MINYLFMIVILTIYNVSSWASDDPTQSNEKPRNYRLRTSNNFYIKGREDAALIIHGINENLAKDLL